MKPSFEKKATIFFFIFFAGLIFLGVISYKNDRSFRNSSYWVIHTHQVLAETELLFSVIKDLQIATRGYALTSDSLFISNLLSAQHQALQHLDNLKALTKDNQSQQPRIDSLKTLVRQRAQHSFETVSQIRKASAVASLTYRGEELMDQIRNLIHSIQTEENQLLLQRNQRNSETAKLLNISFFLLLFAAVVFITSGFVILRKYLIYRREIEERIKRLNATLEQRVAEKTAEIIAQEKRYHFVLDTMHEGIQIIDFDWKYLYVNDALAKQGKYAADELIGCSITGRYPGIENTELFKVLKTCMEERISQRLENEFSFSDGSIGYYDLTIQPVPEGLFILSVDISERKKRELDKENYTKELEKVLFKISHEVRHPIVQILGISQLIEQTELSEEELPAMIGSMKESAVLLDSYTRDLSTFVTSIKSNSESQVT